MHDHQQPPLIIFLLLYVVLPPLISCTPLPSINSSRCPPSHRQLLIYPMTTPPSAISSHLNSLNSSLLYPFPNLKMALICLPPNTAAPYLRTSGATLHADAPLFHTATHKNWALDRIDQPTLPLDNFRYNPFKCSSTLGQNISIFVIDTGCIASHAAFSAAQIASFSSPTSSYPPSDDNGHGTAVASLLVGKGSGSAPRANVTCIKALNSRGTGRFSDVISGVEVAVESLKTSTSRATLLVLSLTAHADAKYKAMDVAVKRAAKVGIVTFAAAGNEGKDACNYTPGRADEAIGVGAIDWKDEMVGFSNVGKCVEVVGPGRKVLVARKGGGYGIVSGTSFAAPLVAGVVALRWEKGKGGGVERARGILKGMGQVGEGYKIATLKGGCHGGGKYVVNGDRWGWLGIGCAGVAMVGIVVGVRFWAWRRDSWWRENRGRRSGVEFGVAAR